MIKEYIIPLGAHINSDGIRNIKSYDFVKYGLYLWSNCKIQDAIDNFTKAIQIEPNCTYAYKFRGQLYLLLKKHKLAIIDSNKLIKIHSKISSKLKKYGYQIDEEFADGYLLRGNAKFRLKRYQDAMDDFTKALEVTDYEITSAIKKLQECRNLLQ